MKKGEIVYIGNGGDEGSLGVLATTEVRTGVIPNQLINVQVDIWNLRGGGPRPW